MTKKLLSLTLIQKTIFVFLFSITSFVNGQTTYDFTTNATLSYGAAGSGIWNTQADIIIGGVAYKLTSGGNGSFTNETTGGASGGVKCLRKEGSGGDSFTLERMDGQPFQFYGIWVRHQSMNSYSQFYTLPPWYTLTATNNSTNQYQDQDMTTMTAGTNWNNYTSSIRTINSGTGGVTVTSVQISFQAIIYFWIDNIIVGPPSIVAPTVTTTAASSVTTTSATLGGNVTSDGGASVTDRGVVWSTVSNPTINDNKASVGTGTGSFSSTINSLSQGTTINFRAFATNSAGTSYGTNSTFTTLSALSATQSQTNVSCNGGSNGSATVSATGGTGVKTYSWAPSGGTSATATGLTAGNYTCTITDGASTTITKSFTITQPTFLSVTAASQTNLSCNGGSNGAASINTPTGGTAPYSYNWTPGTPTGDGTRTVTGLVAGTWTCTVTDANSCTATQSFTLTQPSALSVTAGSQTNVSCNGGSNGSATVSATGGSSGYTYSWSPSGGTSATATGLSAGTYICTVTDINGCTATRSFTITQPAAISVTASSQTNVSCNGGSNGSATVNVTGGTGSYTYSWSPSGGTSATATGLGAGTYTCTVTDANLCTATRSFTITQPTVLAASAGSQTNVSCNGGSNGSATVSVTGGTTGYTYSWSPSGGTSATASGLSAGNYTVTVTDANSCTATRSFAITQPTVLAASAGSRTNVSCNGGSNGTATVNVSGGTGTYTYSWSPSGGTSATATGLIAGNYTVTVTDANSCTTTQSFTITEPSALSVTAGSQTNVSCNRGSNGSATVSVTGGTSGYTYLWSPSGGTSATATALSAGTYTCTVTDANGCTATQTFTITEPVSISAPTATSSLNYCQGATATPLTATPLSGNSLKWYTVATGGSGSATPITPETTTPGSTDYYVAQENNLGCESPRTLITVLVNPSPILYGNFSVELNTTTTLLAITSPANSNAWVSSNSTVASVSNLGVVNGLAIGTTTITYTNNFGCSSETPITVSFGITQPPVLNRPLPNTTSGTNLQIDYILPENPSNGSVQLTFIPTTGGTPIVWTMNNYPSANFVYAVGSDPVISSPSNVTSGAVLPYGTYNITLSYQDSNANPVAIVTNNSVQILAPPSISLSQTSYTGLVNGSITPFTIQNTGGVATYTITPALPNGLSLNTVTGEISGIPTVTIASTSFTVTATNTSGTSNANFTLFVDRDSDGDGIPNLTDPDDDNDGVTDVQELTDGTDSLKADTDGDGVNDGTEKSDATDPTDSCAFILTSQTIAPSTAWNTADCDADGVTNAQELIDGTDPLKADTDGDGVTDSKEKTDGTDAKDSCKFILASQTVATSNAWNAADCDGDGTTNRQEILNNTDPLVGDTDGDGVLDPKEITDGTSRTNSCDFILASQTIAPSSAWNAADCDADGITNAQEKVEGTDSLKSDTDGDGVKDGTEKTDRTDGKDGCKFVLANQTLTPSAAWNTADCDNDGLNNAVEKTKGLNPLLADTDNDGLSDGIEITNGTNPLLQDTDGDGIVDNRDNCPLLVNANQLDNDNDDEGDTCDLDDDNDGILDTIDNCPINANSNQADRDRDGRGDECDLTELNISQVITPNGDGNNDTWIIYNIENHPGTIIRVFNRWGKEVFYSRNYKNDWNGHYKEYDASLPSSGSYYYQIDLEGDGTIDAKGWLYITK